MRISAILLCLSCAIAQDMAPPGALPKLPSPVGPFGIGRVGYHWVDPSRQNRELMVYFWYPASVASANAKGSYLPGAMQMDATQETRELLAREFGSNWSAIVTGAISSHAVERAPIAKTRKRFPLVIFSHGLGSTGFSYTCLIEDLVSHGYVVASIEHTNINLAVWFPDGRVVPRQPERPPAGLSRKESFQWMMERATGMIIMGAADVRFVFDQIAKESPLSGRLDLKHVAAMGHSAGAEFAVRACQLDARFTACVDLDGGMVPVAALPEFPDGAKLRQPLLLLEPGYTERQMAGTPEEHAAYFKKKEEQLQATPPGSYDVILRAPGLLHPAFSDTPLLFAGRDGYPPTETVLHNLSLIEKYVRGFLGRNLRRESDLLLNESNPEATVKRYGRRKE